MIRLTFLFGIGTSAGLSFALFVVLGHRLPHMKESIYKAPHRSLTHPKLPEGSPDEFLKYTKGLETILKYISVIPSKLYIITDHAKDSKKYIPVLYHIKPAGRSP